MVVLVCTNMQYLQIVPGQGHFDVFESVSKTRAPYAGDVLQEHHGVEIKKTVCAIKCVQHQCIIVHQSCVKHCGAL